LGQTPIQLKYLYAQRFYPWQHRWSVGRNTLAVVDSFPEELRVVGLAAAATSNFSPNRSSDIDRNSSQYASRTPPFCACAFRASK
jgi:hypothetical protein